MTCSSPPARADVLIIGGGLSGTLLALQLLRLPGARHIRVIEPRSELGRGEAYSATELGHTLNANAARMSIDPDNPDDLTEWLTAFLAEGGWPQAHEQQLPVAELFPPRGLFGLYARERLAQAIEVGKARGSQVEHVRDEVVDAQVLDGGVRLWLAGGEQLEGACAVLATGMFAAAHTRNTGSNAFNTAALDPWDVAAMRELPVQAKVLIIGSGLTMVDALASLDEAGHRGPVEVYSRHGLLPHVRRQPPAWPDFLAQAPAIASPRQVMAELRRQCRLAMAAGVDWQAPLDTVRVHIARLWSAASEVQKRQFVRHVRPWWESHHHRSPPQGAALLARWQAQGRLQVHAAAFQAVEPLEGRLGVRLRRRGQAQACVVYADALINSSGIEYDWRRVDKPLVRQLLQRGLVTPGPLALGILASPEGAVINAHGTASRQLFAMGPPLRGMWWESTSVNDVASQAKALAARLVGQSVRKCTVSRKL